MKKIIILSLLSIAFNCQSFSQAITIQTNNDFYNSLIDQLGINKSTPVFYMTSLKALKKINFKEADIKNWLRKDTVIGWKAFFGQVNLDNATETVLGDKIGSHPFTDKMYQETKSGPQPFLALSPIIYSGDKTLALCYVLNWKGREEASETVYLLKYKNEKWQIVKFLMLSIS